MYFCCFFDFRHEMNFVHRVRAAYNCHTFYKKLLMLTLSALFTNFVLSTTNFVLSTPFLIKKLEHPITRVIHVKFCIETVFCLDGLLSNVHCSPTETDDDMVLMWNTYFSS